MEGQRRHGQRRLARRAAGDKRRRNLLAQPRPKSHALLTDTPCSVFLPWTLGPCSLPNVCVCLGLASNLSYNSKVAGRATCFVAANSRESGPSPASLTPY